MYGTEFSGFDDIGRALNRLMQNVNELDGKQVPLEELFPPEFVKRHSRFETIDALFANSGFKIETPEDFASIPDDEWDKFIAENTDFSSWEEMMQVGADELFQCELGFR